MHVACAASVLRFVGLGRFGQSRVVILFNIMFVSLHVVAVGGGGDVLCFVSDQFVSLCSRLWFGGAALSCDASVLCPHMMGGCFMGG